MISCAGCGEQISSLEADAFKGLCAHCDKTYLDYLSSLERAR